MVNDTVEIGVNNYPNVVSFNMEVTNNTITFTYTETALFDTAAFNGYILGSGVARNSSLRVDHR